MTITLAYWDIRALAEPTRLMLEYLGLDYTKKCYTNREEWMAEKFALGIEFPNLPYIVDGSVKMSESFAIMKYLARNKGEGELAPKTGEEEARCDVTQGAISDFSRSFLMMCFDPNFKEKRVAYREQLPAKLRSFEEVLGARKWLAGDRLTYVDFAFCEYLDHQELCMPGCLDKTPNVKKYKAAFERLDRIAVYKKSSRFSQYPVLVSFAQWGFKPE